MFFFPSRPLLKFFKLNWLPWFFFLVVFWMWSCLVEVSSRLGSGFPFYSCGQASYVIALHSSRLSRLLPPCTVWLASCTKCLFSMLELLWGFLGRTSTCHFENYHCSLRHPIFKLVSNSIWYQGHAEHPSRLANNQSTFLGIHFVCWLSFIPHYLPSLNSHNPQLCKMKTTL